MALIVVGGVLISLAGKCGVTHRHTYFQEGIMVSFYQIIEKRRLSSRDGEPLVHCSTCAQGLGPDDYFLIAKAFHRGECAMEAVQCMQCQTEAANYVSEQSAENIMLYCGRRFNAFLMNSQERDIYHLQDPSCLITGEDLEPGGDFEMYCFNVPDIDFRDNDFLFVGPTAIEQMSELLSEETRRSWGRYLEELSPSTPDIVVSPMFMR